MSTTYKTVNGDTFEIIASKSYGDGSKASVISSANPGAAEPLAAGLSLIIPALQNEPKNLPQSGIAQEPDEVAILIDGKRFRFWTEVTITRAIDQIDIVEFGSPFEVENQAFREIFRPFSYKRCEVTVGGDPIFTGTLVGTSPDLDIPKRVQASCYSLPGVLNDCSPSAGDFPLEFNDQGLREIATALAAPFGLDVEFNVEQGAVFERVACKPNQKVLAFLADLAKQRNLIITNDERGALVFWNSAETGKPAAILRQGESPLLKVTPTFSPQEYYSHITGIEPVSIGFGGSQYTVQNPRLAGVLRPLTFTVLDSQSADVQSTVAAKAGRMFGNAVTYSIEVNTWRDSGGTLWEPNTTLKIQAPNAMIYNPYEFVIRSVRFVRTGTSATAILDLVLPGSFNGESPETLPWDE